MPHTHYSQPVKRPVGRVYEKPDECGWSSEGNVLTPDGIVWVHSNTYSDTGHTTMHFIDRGRLHIRSFDKYRKPRCLVTLAARFAKEIAK